MLMFFPLIMKGQKTPSRYHYSKPPMDSSAENNNQSLISSSNFQYVQSEAFERYPELKSVEIRFRNRKLKTTMAARPSLMSFFRSNKNRVYYIFINNDSKNPNTVLLNDLPTNAKIGVIGHEYAHILDYESKSKLQLVSYGLKYLLSKKFKRNLENRIDKITISRGLGWQVYNFSSYVFNDTTVTSDYKAYKKKFYFTPAEILKQMVQENEVYQNLSLLLDTSPYLSSF